MKRCNLNLSINTNFENKNENIFSPKTPLINSPKNYLKNIKEEKKRKFQGKKIHQDYETNGELWLGDYIDSFYAYQYGINVIINVAHECNTPLELMSEKKYDIYLHYWLKDNSYEDTSIIVEEIPNKVNNFISKGNKILLHCRKGISRSVSCIIAYLIKYKKLKYNEAYNYILNIQENISPNFGFIHALENLEKN